MNNKKFGLLLSVINVLSILTLEKYWKRGFKITFRKKQKQVATTTLPVAPPSEPAAGSSNNLFSIVA